MTWSSPRESPNPSQTNNNNFPGGTTFNSITIEGSGYDLSGNALDLTAGITANYASGTSTDGIDTTLMAAATPISVTTGATLDFGRAPCSRARSA